MSDQESVNKHRSSLLSLSQKDRYSRGHIAKRTSLQLMGGTYFGGMAGFLVFLFSGQALGCGCPQGQNDNSALDRLDHPIIKIGGPTAFTLVNSIAVYVIGRRIDQRSTGAYTTTLAGSLVGAALGTGLVAGLHHSSGNFPVGAFIGSIFLPALGGTLGYHRSIPSQSAHRTGHQPSRNIPAFTYPRTRGLSGRSATTIFLPIIRLDL
jgi:hypothetical protein